MEDNRLQAGKSALPRPTSRLPMPRSTGIPTALRPSQSRDNLAAAPEIVSSRLRPAASRERLASGISNITNQPSPTAPKNSTSARGLARPRPTSSLPTFTPQPKPLRATSSGNGSGLSRIPPPRDRMASLPEDVDSPRESHASKLPGLRRKSSAQWMPTSQLASPRQRSTSTSTLSNGYASSDSFSQTSPINEDNDIAADDTIRPKTLKPRPSLAERTVQTLSRLPSSPALRGKTSNSNFFEPESYRATSRPASRCSRPGSSLRDDSSTPSKPRPSLSRPGSSSGPLQDLSNPFNPQLPPLESSPARGRGLGTLRTPSTSGLRDRSRSKIGSVRGLPRPRSTTPSKEMPLLAPEFPMNGSKTISTRTVQQRPSVNGLFKKPALPAAKKPASISSAPTKAKAAPLKSPATVSDRSTNLSAASSTSTKSTSVGGDSPPPFKKSSSALRDQIARAKAAKRSVAAKPLVSDEPGQAAAWGESPVVPTDDTFDFGLSDHPFNLNRDANSTSKIVKSRVTTARTSGRLNIAALGLKEIPKEVLDMYSMESIGKYDGSWAESVDLTRFVAADNELEMIDESVFPDVDPEELAEDEDAQGSIFAGLETLDLHGNVLIALPAGLRRLTLLTSLNLVCHHLSSCCEKSANAGTVF